MRVSDSSYLEDKYRHIPAVKPLRAEIESIRLDDICASQSISDAEVLQAPGPPLGTPVTEIRADRATKGFQGDKTPFLVRPDLCEGQYLLTDINRYVLPSTIYAKGKNRKVRARNCMTFPVTKSGDVEHKRSNKTGRHRFTGLNACGSVHICPTCGTAIKECRAARCRMATDECLRDGGSVPLVTLTTSHSRDDSLIDLVRNFKATRSAFHKTRPVAELKKLVRCQGVVWVMEINFHKLNGWHVHFHELWFCLDEFSLSGLESELFPHWERLCVRHGLKKPERFRPGPDGEDIGLGVNVCGGESAAGYLAKTSKSLAAELQGKAKTGRSEYTCTITDLLILAGQDKNWARRRYTEFCRATLGLGFMDGLKQVADFFHVEGISESDVIRHLTAEWEYLGDLGRDHYFELRKRGLIPEIYKRLDSGQTLESALTDVLT